MANPFLVLGGIAVGVITATFGVLQVPGWVASAQDAAAINDLANIRAAQAIHAAETGTYASELTPSDAGWLTPVSNPVAAGAVVTADAPEMGVRVALSGGVDLVAMAGTDQGWCGVVQSASGRYFAGSETGVTSTGDATVTSTVQRAECLPTLANQVIVAAGETAIAEHAATFTLNCPADANVILPLYGANGTVTWSDDETTEISGQMTTPKHLTAGVEYKVHFDGTFEKLSTVPGAGHTAPSINALACFRSMDEWAEDAGTTSAEYAFSAMVNLVSVPDRLPSTVTTLKAAFANTSVFNDPSVVDWDTRNVTSLEQTFASATNFNQPIGNWNTSKVTNMLGTFAAAMAFNQPLNWDVTKVTTTQQMFRWATAFNQPLTDWKMPLNTDTSMMFQFATEFNSAVSGWDVSNVKKMNSMFQGAAAFNRPLDGWDVSNVTTVANMFKDAAAFDQPVGHWDTGKVTDIAGLFHNASSFNHPVNDWDVSQVYSAADAFKGTTSFDQPLDKWASQLPAHITMANLFGTT